MPKSPAIPKALKDATKGLHFYSETDSPISAFAWPPGPITVPEIRVRAGLDESAVVRRISLADAMRSVPASARGSYFPLLVALVDTLTDIEVYKIGRIRAALYIVGTTSEGNRAGVKTELVET
jgi:hypothetical protein